MNITELIYSRE